MVSGFLVLGGLGVVIGVVLALASKIFYVYVDPKIEAVEDALPGANCGGCGLPGCSSNAVAIVTGKSSASSCVAGGPDVAAEIAALMGVTITLKEPEIAAPGCSYGYQDADVKYLYQGIHDCRAAALLDGGSKICTIGCLGLGTCVNACPFGALSMGPDNLPVVDTELCTGCGTCERVCPKHIITLTSTSDRIIGEYVTDECTRSLSKELSNRDKHTRVHSGDPQPQLRSRPCHHKGEMPPTPHMRIHLPGPVRACVPAQPYRRGSRHKSTEAVCGRL